MFQRQEDRQINIIQRDRKRYTMRVIKKINIDRQQGREVERKKDGETGTEKNKEKNKK